MDETTKPNVREMLDEQPKLRREIDKQTAGFRAAAAVADEMNLREGFRTASDMRTEDDKCNEAKAEECLKELKNSKPKRAEHRREAPYPELPKGKLLFQTDEYDAPKEYITLQMNENKELVKKILNEKGSLTGHPEIPVSAMEWDLPNLDCIQKAIREEFPDGKLIEEKGGNIAELISKYLGGTKVSFDCGYKLIVKSVPTKFRLKDVTAAVKALSDILPAKEAERIVAREIAKKIQNVL